MSAERRVTWDAGFWAAAGVALVALMVAATGGVAPGRTGPAAGFALLWFAAASYVLLADRASRRRAERQRAAPVPQGVLLVRPIWIPLGETFQVVAVGAALGAGAALVGFPWVGVGMLLALAALGLAIEPFARGTGLTFEPSGLRIHMRRAQCLVPWSAIVDVSAAAATRSQVAFVNIRVADPGVVFASLAPDTRQTKFDLWLRFTMGTPKGQALWFRDWSAGLDCETLARAVREASGKPPSSPVN